MAPRVVEDVAPAGVALPAANSIAAADAPLAVQQLPPGLVNLGNSCYMNSVLQTLASSQRFCAYLDERARAVQYGMSRVSAAAPPTQRPVGLGRMPLQQQRRRGAVSTATAAAEGGRVDPRVMALAAATAAVEVVDAAGAIVAPLLQALARALCRAALWLQGWEPPPLAAAQHRHHHHQQGRGRQAQSQPPQQPTLSLFAAAACAPLHAVTPRRGRPLPPPTPAAAALQRLAAGLLLLQLEDVLRRLQPSYTRATNAAGAVAVGATAPPVRPCRTGPVDPSALLAALRNQLPGSSLRLGQQNDAAEALACLCDCLETELAAWYLLYGRWIHQVPLEQLAAAPAKEGAADKDGPGAADKDAAAETDARRGGDGGHADDVRTPTQTGAGCTTAAAAATFAAAVAGGTADGRASRGMSSSDELFRSAAAAAASSSGGSSPLPPRCPLRGLLAATTTCCECGGRSVSHVEPFWSLQLPLPHPPPSRTASAPPPPAPAPPPPALLLQPQRDPPHLAAAAAAAGVAATGRQPLLPSLDPEAAGGAAAGRRPSSSSSSSSQEPQRRRSEGSQTQLQARKARAPVHAAAGPAAAAGTSGGGWTDPAPGGGGGDGGGLRLQDCLMRALQPDRVEGVECCRCSLKAALRRVRAAGVDPGPRIHCPAATAAAAAPGQRHPAPEPPPRNGSDTVPPSEANGTSPLPGPGQGLVSGSNLGCCRRPGPDGGCDGDGGGGGDGTANNGRCGDGFGALVDPQGGCYIDSGCGNGSGGGSTSDDLSCSSSSCSAAAERVAAGRAAWAMEAGGEVPGTTTTTTRKAAAAAAESAVVEEEVQKEDVERAWNERQLARLEALLSGPHLPSLDLDLELAQLQGLLVRGSSGTSDSGGAAAAASVLPSAPGAVASLVAAAAAPPPSRLEAVRTRALRRTRVARCPPVLVLQLLRTVWDPRVGAAVKDGRRVIFPLMLGPAEMELLGMTTTPAVAEAKEAEGEEAEEEEEAVPRPHILTAVVVHYGGADSGHYLMYRRIQMTGAALRDGSGPQGYSSDSSVCSGGVSDGAWLRVSDSSVSLADEREVMQQAAAVLMYERQ